jgi:hypothetical protein
VAACCFTRLREAAFSAWRQDRQAGSGQRDRRNASCASSLEDVTAVEAQRGLPQWVQGVVRHENVRHEVETAAMPRRCRVRKLVWPHRTPKGEQEPRKLLS